MSEPRRIKVWAELEDPATVFPLDKFPKKPVNKHTKQKIFKNYVLCELIEIPKRKRK